jgi:hypothetical protein
MYSTYTAGNISALQSALFCLHCLLVTTDFILEACNSVLAFIQPLTGVNSRKCLSAVKSSQHIRLTTSPHVSRMSRKCGILNISQSYRSPWSIMGIAFFFIYFITSPHNYKIHTKYLTQWKFLN